MDRLDALPRVDDERGLRGRRKNDYRLVEEKVDGEFCCTPVYGRRSGRLNRGRGDPGIYGGGNTDRGRLGGSRTLVSKTRVGPSLGAGGEEVKTRGYRSRTRPFTRKVLCWSRGVVLAPVGT